MKRACVFAIVVVWISTNISWATYEWFINPDNGHQYALTLEHSNWADAEAEAIAQGGHLVTVNDQDESDWLLDPAYPFGATYSRDYQGVSNQNAFWIGLEYIGPDRYSPSSWKWQTDEPVTFWNPHHELYPTGIYMTMNGRYHWEPGTWNCSPAHDTIPSHYLRGVIEVIPEPTTLSLFALGALALLRRRTKP